MRRLICSKWIFLEEVIQGFKVIRIPTPLCIPVLLDFLTIIDFAYAQVVIASRLSGITAPLASPPLGFRDAEAIERNARRLRGMGLGGHLCIHPAQVAPIHAGFEPSSQEIEWATRVIDSVGGAVQVAGEMVDKPVREKAARILAEVGRRRP